MHTTHQKAKTIAVITCWYGPFPWYFPYFIHSCRANPSVDFFIVTDNRAAIPAQPGNVKIVYMAMEDLAQMASEKMGFTVNMAYPYKLCDFKPAYGFFFADLLRDYDFWGHGDIDVVYGDIRGFMTAELLEQYDVISCRHDYITGTFCLFRNNPYLNTLFMQSEHYREVFTNEQHYCFDECNFLFDELNNGASIFDFPNHIQSMTYVVKKEEAMGRLKAHFDFIILEGVPGDIKWEDGKVVYQDCFEAMFYHLILFKNMCRQQVVLNPMPDAFFFTRDEVKAIA
jgi:hypothetical protein